MIRLILAAWLFYKAGQQADPWLASLFVVFSIACYVSGLRAVRKRIEKDRNRNL